MNENGTDNHFPPHSATIFFTVSNSLRPYSYQLMGSNPTAAQSVSVLGTPKRSRRSSAVVRPNSSNITSKVHNSPLWLQKASSISKVVARKHSGKAIDLESRHEKNQGQRVNKAPDQSGIGNAVHFWPRSCNPYNAPQPVTIGNGPIKLSR